MNREPEGPDRGIPETPPAHVALWIVLGLAAVFAWRFVFTWAFNLIPDECSYWAWSRRLDWSYFDNSGGVAYLIRVSTWLFGDYSPFSVRFPFLVLSLWSSYLVYRISFDLFGDRLRALFCALVVNLAPVAFLGGSAAIHDNALLFFWLATVWAAVRFIEKENSRWFFVMGLTSGLAIQSKYTGVLVVISVLLFLLLGGRHRKHLYRREPWIAALIAAVFTLPIIWWNVQHDWASLYHILFIGSGAQSLWTRISDGITYHLAQILVVSPLFYAALVAALGSSILHTILRPDPKTVLLLAFSLPLFLFGVLAFFGHVEANWAFVGYAPAAILVVEVIARAQADLPGRHWSRVNRSFFRWAVLVAVVPSVVVVLHAWLGLLPADLERKLGKTDRVVWETRGWKELGAHVGKLAKPDDVIAADSYQLCALLEFNVPGNPKVRYLAPWKRPTQFDVWAPSFDDLQGRSILFVSPKPLVPSAPGRVTVYENFQEVEALPTYHVQYHGESIREVYVCRGVDFNPFSPVRLGPRSLFYKDW
ncbi:MAG: glycosyltransferase family 39 protein [Thermodesulfobacteriota bacterium]